MQNQTVVTHEQLTMPICSIERHRLATDGVGVTTLVASYGCPLACKYCINPGTWNPKTLPHCVQMTPEMLYEKVKIDDLYFLATSGGVTFGGGESLLHAEFIAAFRKVCGDGWRLTAETSLNVPKENFAKALMVVDDFIVDVKDLNPEIYKAYTGQMLEHMLENLAMLAKEASSERVRIRVPKIPGYNGEQDIRKTVDKLQEMGFENIEVFPYVIRKKE